jgi:hypothetical protein
MRFDVEKITITGRMRERPMDCVYVAFVRSMRINHGVLGVMASVGDSGWC